MPDVLIIGGGIAGLLSARELASNGARVTILECNDQPARESSWAGGGILSPLYPWRYADSVTRLSLWSQGVYPSLCEELHTTAGFDPEYISSGLFIHAPGEEEQALAWAGEFQQALEILDRDEVHRLEPERRDPSSPMLWLPRVAQVRNPRLTRALLVELQQRGVEIRTGTCVERLEIEGKGTPLVVTGSGRLEAGRIVICAGAWSGRLLESLQPRPDIHPVRGQMLLFRTRPGLIRHMMLEENRYIIPRRDGRVLFGSTLEQTGFDKSTTAEARKELRRIALARFPALAEYPVEAHWAGLRPGSPAGIPWIGRHPNHENLFINAGHFRNGVVLGPASARLVADLLLGREPILDPSPYSFTAERPATP